MWVVGYGLEAALVDPSLVRGKREPFASDPFSACRMESEIAEPARLGLLGGDVSVARRGILRIQTY